ncbi:MAG: chemotaxis protein CheX [Planctomycetaceae bacterium]|nr:chemotaxis protein CheX [Planctomycetaceae bacterium]
MVTNEDVMQITEHVLGTMLELGSYADSADNLLTDRLEAFTGCVHISGEWQGAVVVQGTPELGRLIAQRFLQLAPGEVSEVDVMDSAAELTNMIGGNIKGLVPGPSSLSIPSVTIGSDFNFRLPGTRESAHVVANCEGQPLRITLCESTK